MASSTPSDSSSSVPSSLMEGFSKLNRSQRLQYLHDHHYLDDEDLHMLQTEKGLNADLAEKFIENVIGCFQMPLGVAVNFKIDDKDYIIPMAVEETSIIASLSKNAKWIRKEGRITTQTLGTLMIGQIQLPNVKDFEKVKNSIALQKENLINEVNENPLKHLLAHGGGLKDLVVRLIHRTDGGQMAVIHVLLDVGDAMGANMTNQACEYLKPLIATLTEETVGLCILSNLSDTKLTQAEVIISNVDPELGQAIVEASVFAEHDPYRAATSNKGVMNGIDPVLIATGNDWRAVEAGVHAYAARLGQYTSITRWTMNNTDLIGIIEAPILVGIVGGVTRLHPLAKLCLKLMRIKSSEELARVVAAVGLVQNLAAIRALATEGISRGHMRLHTSNIAVAAGATPEELLLLKPLLESYLEQHRNVNQHIAMEFLDKIRKK